MLAQSLASALFSFQTPPLNQKPVGSGPRASPSAAPALNTVTLFSELGICQVRNSPDNGATLAARVRFLPSLGRFPCYQGCYLAVSENLMSQIPPSALPPCLWGSHRTCSILHLKPPIPDSSIGTSAPGKKGGTETCLDAGGSLRPLYICRGQ